jgi:hypothetical protein
MYPTHGPCGHLENLFSIPFGGAERGIKFRLIQKLPGSPVRTPAPQENEEKNGASGSAVIRMTTHADEVSTAVGCFFDHQA